MLLGLRLHNIALVESLDLSFQNGFSVFTGETGAGKSIFLLSIDALLGGANISGSRLMRVGTNNCLIEGCFSIDSKVKNWLIENRFDMEVNEIFISRDWRLRDGRLTSRLRLNGEIINLKQIFSLRKLLIDISLQGESQTLNSPSEQLKMLDRFGDKKIAEVLLNVRRSWDIWREKKIKLDNAQKELNIVRNQIIHMQNFLDDFQLLNINNPLEEDMLKEEQDRLVHGVKLQESLYVIFNSLKDCSNEYPSVLDHFQKCIRELQSIIKLDSSLSKQLDLILEINNKLEEFLYNLASYQSLLESNPQQLDLVQSRILEIDRIKKRYDLDLNGLLKQRDHYQESLDTNNSIEKISDLVTEENLSRLDLEKHSLILSKLRRKYASILEQEIIKYLKPLGLDNIKFEVAFSSSQLSVTGCDSIQFLFSANEGQPLAPLADVASGGELSRFLLVLKSLFTKSNSTILIFDEIDSGVSGRISSAIAKLLKDLSLNTQVFCITHQPLVAALADHHFSVSKSVDRGMTNSKVLLLRGFKERQVELAKLAGGDFEKASVFAASLLDTKAA